MGVAVGRVVAISVGDGGMVGVCVGIVDGVVVAVGMGVAVVVGDGGTVGVVVAVGCSSGVKAMLFHRASLETTKPVCWIG